MSKIQFDKGRLKIGRYSLSNLAIAEALSAGVFFILTLILGWSAWKDFRTYFAWGGAIRAYASNVDPTGDLDTVISNRPEFAAPHELRAKVAVSSGDFEKARAEYEIIQKIDPNNEASVVGMGVLALREFDKKKQEALLSTAKSSFALAASNADAKVGIGNVMLRQSDLEGAWKQFESALSTDPPASIDGMVDLYVGKGSILVKRGNALAARQEFEKALFLRPTWDRGYANIAYLLAQQMSETTGMERDKFKAASVTWQAFANQMAILYLQNRETRAYFKDALVTFYDAFSCLSLRCLDLGSASGKAGQIKAYDMYSKRPTVNYIATLGQVITGTTLNIEERRQLVLELSNVGEGAPIKHKDLTSREKAVIYQLLSVVWVINTSNYGKAIKFAELAEEEYAKGGVEDHLKAMILRVKFSAIWKSKQYAPPAEGQALIDRAMKAADESLLAETQPDLDAWIKGIRNK